MRASRVLASAVFGGVIPLVAAVVRAQPTPSVDTARVTLTWHAPTGCPEEGAVRNGLLVLLAGSQAAVSARADVVRAGDTWRVLVVMNGGERRLEATTCRAIAEATELIVAMAADPERVAKNRASVSRADAGASDAAPADLGPVVDASAPPVVALPDAAVVDGASPAAEPPPPAPSPAAAPTVEATAAPTASTAPWPSTRFAVSASGVVDIGTLPAPAVGPSVAFAWTPRFFRFEIAGAYFFPDSTPPTPTTGAVARFTLITGSLRGCVVAPLPPSARLDIGGCVLAEVASAHGEGLGILHPSSGSSTWLSPGAGVTAGFRVLRPLALVTRGDALIPTKRDDFQFDTSLVHRPSLVAGRLSIGAELRF